MTRIDTDNTDAHLADRSKNSVSLGCSAFSFNMSEPIYEHL